MLNKLLTKPSILNAKRLEKVININSYSIKPEKQSGKIKIIYMELSLNQHKHVNKNYFT